MSAVTSQKAREEAHPQLFRSLLQDKPALYFPVKLADPPVTYYLTREKK